MKNYFKEYCKKQGWLYKHHQGYGADANIVDTVNNSNTRKTLVAQLEPVDHSYYPYMDTMVYYNPDNGKISNKQNGMRIYVSRYWWSL